MTHLAEQKEFSSIMGGRFDDAVPVIERSMKGQIVVNSFCQTSRMVEDASCTSRDCFPSESTTASAMIGRRKTFEERNAHVSAVLRRLRRWEDAHFRRAVRLASIYAERAGFRQPDGYLFHCLENWTKPGGPEEGNMLAQKAVWAYRNRFGEHLQRRDRVYRLACAKYFRPSSWS